jgi:hypothetical protein
MAKQRGGSPFTDSWFEMPFWILFFLLVVTVILLWQFGIFNKPAPVAPAKPVQAVLPGVTRQGVLNIHEVVQGNDLITAKVTYSTVDAPHGSKVMFRIVDSITDRQYSEYNTSIKPESVQVSAGIGNPTTNQSVQGYLSLNGTPLTPVQNVPVRIIQQGARNSSGSSDPLPSASSGLSKKAYTSPSLVGTL